MSDKWYISGPLGIGAEPSHPLHVKTDWSFLALDTNAAGQDSGVRLMEGGAVKWHIFNHGPTKTLRFTRDGLANSLTIDETARVGIGTATPAGKLDVQGDIRAGNSDIYFTKPDHVHSGIGNTAGYAAIENARDFDALMILGRAGTDKGRKVRLWDYLEVNGSLNVTGGIRINGELPFHYQIFNVPGRDSTTDTGWEVSKYVVLIVGFSFPPDRFPAQVFIDRSGNTSMIRVRSSTGPSNCDIHVVRIRLELFG